MSDIPYLKSILAESLSLGPVADSISVQSDDCVVEGVSMLVNDVCFGYDVRLVIDESEESGQVKQVWLSAFVEGDVSKNPALLTLLRCNESGLFSKTLKSFPFEVSKDCFHHMDVILILVLENSKYKIKISEFLISSRDDDKELYKDFSWL